MLSLRHEHIICNDIYLLFIIHLFIYWNQMLGIIKKLNLNQQRTNLFRVECIEADSFICWFLVSKLYVII